MLLFIDDFANWDFAADRNYKDDMQSLGLPDEPAVTSALVTRFRDALHGYEKAGIRWSAKILSSHGSGEDHARDQYYGRQ